MRRAPRVRGRAGLTQANSAVTVLPSTTAPAARNWATTAASARGRCPAKMADPYSLGWSAVSKMSFTPSVIPLRGPAGAFRASSRARSSSRKANARTVGSRSAITLSAASMAAEGDGRGIHADQSVAAGSSHDRFNDVVEASSHHRPARRSGVGTNVTGVPPFTAPAIRGAVEAARGPVELGP